MLKRDFTEFYNFFTNYIFGKYEQFMCDSRYGVTSIKNFDQVYLFLVGEFLDKISKTNRRIPPGSNIILPACISYDQLSQIITDIKTKYNG